MPSGLKKVKFKSNTTDAGMSSGFATIINKTNKIVYMPINGFTTIDIEYKRGNNIYNTVNRFDEDALTAHYITL